MKRTPTLRQLLTAAGVNVTSVERDHGDNRTQAHTVGTGWVDTVKVQVTTTVDETQVSAVPLLGPRWVSVTFDQGTRDPARVAAAVAHVVALARGETPEPLPFRTY